MSGKTDYLVAAAPSGAQHEKASALPGVTLLDEAGFARLWSGGASPSPVDRARFPEADQPGHAAEGLDRALMRQLAEAAPRLTPDALAEILSEHARFLLQGGEHGRWQSLQAGGIAMAVYECRQETTASQASFHLKRLPEVLPRAIRLPHASFCVAWGQGADLSASNLSDSTFTDAFFRDACFDGAYLRGVDFSRADLRGASFRGADLKDADFEGSDLQGADFSGALHLDQARFPGANLHDVVI